MRMSPGPTLIPALVYAVLFAVGTLGHYIDGTRDLMLQMTPWFLLLLGGTALAPLATGRAWKPLLWAAATYGVTFGLEVIGVATGAIFGAYTYGSTLGIKLMSVPLIIGFNWVIVVLGSIQMTGRLIARLERHTGERPRRIVRRVIAPVMVGLMAVLFDLCLEPVAIGLGYWNWESIQVPVQNYVAWFVIAGVTAVPFFALRLEVPSPRPAVYVALQFLFILSLVPLGVMLL